MVLDLLTVAPLLLLLLLPPPPLLPLLAALWPERSLLLGLLGAEPTTFEKYYFF